jgi:hypothetical protein
MRFGQTRREKDLQAITVYSRGWQLAKKKAPKSAQALGLRRLQSFCGYLWAAGNSESGDSRRASSTVQIT